MNKNELLLYRTNSLPSSLAMLFLLFNTAQTIFTLNAVDPGATGIRIMEVILLNILLSFLVFIAASEIKRYNMSWSIAALGIGIFQCLRFFLIPGGADVLHIRIVVPLLTAGVILITASIISLEKCAAYRQAKKEVS